MKQATWAAVFKNRRLIIGLGLLFAAWTAQAGIMGDIDDKFRPMQAQWFGALKGAASNLFWLLAAIDFAWHSVAQVMETGELEAVLKGVMKRIFRYGMFFALLKFSDSWLQAIIASFRQLGATASGTGAVTPDAIVDLGIKTTIDIMGAIGDKGLIDTLVLGLPLMFLGIVIFVCFVFVALQVLITQIEIYIVCGAGVVIMGFGGSVWTKDMAVNLYKYAIQVGVKLLILMLVVGIGMSIAQSLVVSPDNLLKSALTTFGSALIFAYLAVKAPALANGMLTGSGSLSAGDMAGTAVAAVAGTAAMAAGGAAAAGMATQAGGGALAGAGGIAQAVGAGLNSASDMGKTGVDAAMHAGKEVAAHGLSMAGATAAQAMGGAQGSFGDRVAESTGGKIAQSIEATRGGSMGPAGGSPSPAAAGPTPAAAPGPGAAPQGSASGGDDIAASQQAFMESEAASSSASSFGEAAGAGSAAPGNAAGATLEAAAPQGSGGAPGGGGGGGGGDSRKMHERILGQRDFLPEDAVMAGSTAHIDTNARGE